MSNSKAAPHLYGHSRPKSKPIPISQSSIHSLGTELSLAKANLAKSRSAADSSEQSTTTTHGRPRGTKSTSLLSWSNRGVQSRAAKDLRDDDDRRSRGIIKSSGKGKSSEGGDMGLTEAELARSRRKMEEKAKLYDALRKGEYVPGSEKLGKLGDEEERLVDFDRKWAEEGSGSESDHNGKDEEEDDDLEGVIEYGEAWGAKETIEMVEYTDEFGRTRTVPKPIAEKIIRKLQREAGIHNPDREDEGQEEEKEDNLIYGNVIQTQAFTTSQFSTLPPQIPRPASPKLPSAEETHYDASSEIRTKGTGFYAFSADSEERKKKMEELNERTRKTEEERMKREEAKKRRREEIEKRKEVVRKKRRAVVGERWLEGFLGELEAGGGKEEKKENEGDKSGGTRREQEKEEQAEK